VNRSPLFARGVLQLSATRVVRIVTEVAKVASWMVTIWKVVRRPLHWVFYGREHLVDGFLVSILWIVVAEMVLCIRGMCNIWLTLVLVLWLVEAELMRRISPRQRWISALRLEVSRS